jgi:hypothetical protein
MKTNGLTKRIQMTSKIIVHKNRVNVLSVSLGFDASGDVITSQIRSEPDTEAPLIAEWNVTFLTDGSDGECVFTIGEIDITANSGYMDIKRFSEGQALPVFDKPLEVDFRGTVTL